MDRNNERVSFKRINFFIMRNLKKNYKTVRNYLEVQNQQGFDPKKAVRDLYIHSNRVNQVLEINCCNIYRESAEEIHLIAHDLN